MSLTFRKLSKRFFILANAIAALLFLLACLQPWLNPETFWIMGFLSLTLPYLVLLLLAFILFWMIFRPGLVFISLLALAIGFKQVGALFAFNPTEFQAKKDPADFRIMTWNLRSLRGIGNLTNRQRIANRLEMFKLIDRYKPDVVCFQEFGQFDQPDAQRDNIKEMGRIGFKHYVLSKDYTRVHFGFSNGLAIFSRTPLLTKKRIPFTSNPESLLYADVKGLNDTLRIFTSHLQSYKFAERDYFDLQAMSKSGEDKMVNAGKSIFAKMKRAFRNRGQQADQVRPWLDSSLHPVLFGGDLNDVPGSYAYWQLRKGRKDAFVEKGFGIGRTYMDLAPTLRIDCLFADQQLEVMQCRVVPTTLSDHLPVIADVRMITED